MKLSRLLILIIAFLWALIFIGILSIITSNTRDYLVKQMRSHAQDTATSLGLSLTASLQNSDAATMNSMVDAIFDRGYYREITVRSITGKIILSRTQPAPLSEIAPAWFTQILVLDTPREESLVMQGWKQIAAIEVVSHPGHAYQELWHVSLQAFWWIMGLGVASFVLLLVVLRAALAPLAEMETQALGIAERRFSILKKIPWARELRCVAKAMDSMSMTVEHMLGEQAAMVDKMRAKAYLDNVTGLENGRSFNERLTHLLSTPDEFTSGALFFIHLGRFQEYNDKYGHAAGDKLLRQAAQILGKVRAKHEQCLLARMNGAEFAILVPDMAAKEEMDALGAAIIRALSVLREEDGSGILIHIGIAPCRAGQGVAGLLAAADMALHASRHGEKSAWQIYDMKNQRGVPSTGKEQWKSAIESAIHGGGITLQFQPVVSCTDRRELHQEALVRIAAADGALAPASIFVPVVKQLGLAQEMDKLVINRMLEYMAGSPTDRKVAINLFAASVCNVNFIEWLCARLSGHASVAARLIFETPEYALLNDIDSFKIAIRRIRETGAQFSLDHFGHSAASVGFLRNLQPDYIKIDGSFIRQIQQNADNQFFIQALAGIAHGLGIQIIAEYVETAEEFDMLKTLPVDGAQGYYTGKPQLPDGHAY